MKSCLSASCSKLVHTPAATISSSLSLEDQFMLRANIIYMSTRTVCYAPNSILATFLAQQQHSLHMRHFCGELQQRRWSLKVNDVALHSSPVHCAHNSCAQHRCVHAMTLLINARIPPARHIYLSKNNSSRTGRKIKEKRKNPKYFHRRLYFLSHPRQEP